MFPTAAKPDRRSPLPSAGGPIPGRSSRASDLLFDAKPAPQPGFERHPKQTEQSPLDPPIPATKSASADLSVDQWGLHRILSTTHLRGNDRQGAGYYGAKRDVGTGDGLHNGIDLAAAPGAAILSPATGTVYIGDAYRRGSQRYGKLSRLTVIDSSGHIINIMYAAPVPGLEDQSQVTAGQVIGYAEDMRMYYGPGMTNHVHVETLVRRANQNVYFDPTPWVRSWSRKPTDGVR